MLGPLSEGDPFMIMHQFGPWSVKDKRHMQKFGRLILALTIRAREDRESS